MKEREIVTNSAKETQELAGGFVGEVLAEARAMEDGARLICLWGDLGSGKTTFTQGVAEALKVKGMVNSPTFLIMKKYPLLGEFKGMNLYHFDCYRIRSAEEIDDLGWREILADEHNLVVVEWPELIAEILPEKRIDIEFETVAEDARRIVFKDRE
ncbi:MAG: tRNA (adenosine(37)-N6)-threonylcarbamoyltransferase complex ATPase subunit type 1 TsaE [Candidatus Paceibacterota bacterium]|jgi:tRNA threonylcarbamoyladenosine biosynthesis protein TsaE